MKNSNTSERSRGVVLFAFNTTVDYVAIADQTSRLISHHLKLPITLVTDDTSLPSFAYDHVVQVTPTEINNYRRTRSDHVIPWRNSDRYRAYEFSPYDETILLDCDYLVLDQDLNKLFEIEFDYLLQHANHDLQGNGHNVMGENSLPFVWATVILFRKTPKTQLLFDLVGRIQRNYDYYRQLYHIQGSDYRNDYAFAIASIILNGYTIGQGIPWPMVSIYEKIHSIKFEDGFLKVSQGTTASVLPRRDIHILDKTYLETNDFHELVRSLCES